jgi:hypothetical protein
VTLPISTLRSNPEVQTTFIFDDLFTFHPELHFEGLAIEKEEYAPLELITELEDLPLCNGNTYNIVESCIPIDAFLPLNNLKKVKSVHVVRFAKDV